MLQRRAALDTSYDGQEPVRFVEDVVRNLNKKGFVTFRRSDFSGEQADAIAQDVLQGAEDQFRGCPRELGEGLLGFDSFGRIADVVAGESELGSLDASVTEYLDLMIQCSQDTLGCNLNSRTGTLLLELQGGGAGQGTAGNCRSMAEAMSWVEAFTCQKLMVLCFLGPGSGTLTLKPFDDDSESFTVPVEPGTWIILRADSLGHEFSVPAGMRSFMLTSFFLEDMSSGPCRNAACVQKNRIAQNMEAGIMDFVRGQKESAEDEAAFQASVGRAAQMTANRMFHKGDQVAIRGHNCRGSGGFNTSDEFFNAAFLGPDTAEEVPNLRYNVYDGYIDDPSLCIERSASYSKHGCFMEGIDLFDTKFFNMSVAEAKSMDVHQKHLLEVGYTAFVHAGWVKKTLMRSWTGCCVGGTASEWIYVEKNTQEQDAFGGTGMSLAIHANRMSYILGLMGPSYGIDIEAAASMVAFVQAADQVQTGKLQADQSIAMGSEVVVSRQTNLHLSWAGLLSWTGRVASFNDNADGFIRGDMVGACVLNSLMKEIDGQFLMEAGDLRGIASATRSSHSGHTAGFGSPSGASDGVLYNNVIKTACIDALDVDIIECFGVGNILQDAVEMAGIAKVYRGEPTNEMLALTAGKTNFGNAGTASGINSILKALGATNWGSVSPTVHLKCSNPHCDTDETGPLFLATEIVANRLYGSFVGVTAKSWSGCACHCILHGTVDGNKLVPEKAKTSKDNQKQLVFWPGGGGTMDRADKPSRDYTIVGSWSGWEPQAMRSEGKGNYSHVITLGESGFERFQISFDGKTERVLHPHSQEGVKDARVHGPVPASECYGSCWQIDGRHKLRWQDTSLGESEEDGAGDGRLVRYAGPDVGEPGEQYKIMLENLGKYRVVTWKKETEIQDDEEVAVTAMVSTGIYSVVGSFTGWEVQDMTREASDTSTVYTCDVKLTHEGDEFQIVVNGESKVAFYPEYTCSGPGPAMGPDELCRNRVWKLGGVSGDSFKIVLERSIRSKVMVTTVRWEKVAHEDVPVAPASYCVVGNWDQFARPVEMTLRDGVYVLRRDMPRTGTENFVILTDGLFSQQCHPSIPNANPHSFHVVQGSANALETGLSWSVGFHPSDEVMRGKDYEIILELSSRGRPKKVSWQPVGGWNMERIGDIAA